MRKRIDIHACKNCENETLTEELFEDSIDFRGLLLEIEGLKRFRCEQCNHVWEGAEHVAHNKELVRQAYNKKRELVREELGLLSGQEIHRILELLDLTQKEASTLFGGGANAFNKYESGEVLQSVAMDRLLRVAFLLGNPAKPLIDFASRIKIRSDSQYVRFGSYIHTIAILAHSNNVFTVGGINQQYDVNSRDCLVGPGETKPNKIANWSFDVQSYYRQPIPSTRILISAE